MNNKKLTENKAKCRKRRQPSVSSSDAEDSDITYPESGESDFEIERDSENDRNLENTMLPYNYNIEEKQTTETKQTQYEIEENHERRESKVDEKTGENIFREKQIQILQSVEVQTVLDDKTGTFKVIIEKPEVGKYVLVKFDGKRAKTNYRYVCMIQEVYGERIVVQGLRSWKLKNTYKLIKNDVSIIDESEILSYLPTPVTQNNNIVFPCLIDVKELV